MENASDALKIAFAMIVFAIAITILFVMVSKTKSTADVVLYYSDNTNFHAQYPGAGENYNIVSISDVVATLYRYYNESVAVTIKLKGKEPYNFDLGNETILIKDENGKELLKLSTSQNIEKNLGEFITKNINSLPEETRFNETFVEVPISGIYSTGEDGSEITLSSGGKKVYITYEQV